MNENLGKCKSNLKTRRKKMEILELKTQNVILLKTIYIT